ncbi:MAG: T9SS type A sorting domain-containing protein [Candidatus Latescibacteria bacterium]|nr:T9SS type A sorting domain-containing protein [Candidatus Latescibacterota bacterium]
MSGDYAIVGAYSDDHAGGSDAGSAYIYHFTDALSLGPTTAGHQAEATPLPDEYTLRQSYPNPFNPTATIRYQLPEPGNVNLTIYDLLGQEVRVLVSETQPGGWYRARWDGKNEAGKRVASGVYLYRLKVGEGFLQTRKMMVVR